MMKSSIRGLTQISQRHVLLAGLASAGLALSLASPDAMAQATGNTGMAIPSSGKSIGTIASNITTSVKGAGVLVTAFSYLGALAFGFMGALKWKAYGEQPDRTPLKVPVTYLAIAAILAALPEFIGTGVSTIWGGGAQVVAEPL